MTSGSLLCDCVTFNPNSDMCKAVTIHKCIMIRSNDRMLYGMWVLGDKNGIYSRNLVHVIWRHSGVGCALTVKPEFIYLIV